MYDLLIIGGGPGGLSAAIYAARFKLKTIVLTKEMGGLVAKVDKIENYPGYKSITGPNLAKKFEEHVNNLNVEIVNETVGDVKKKEDIFIVKTKKNEYEAKTILFATGTQRRKLGVPGEDEFLGKGVSYCATCDGPFFKDKIVGVVGGSDSAAREALFLAQHAKKVYIIYRKEEIRAEPITKELVNKNNKIEIINNTNVIEIKGDKVIKSVMFDNGKEFELEGLFIEIGGVPGSFLAKKLGIKLRDNGEIIVDTEMKTSMDGVYAAGDITSGIYKQIVTAAAGGVLATLAAFKYIKLKK